MAWHAIRLELARTPQFPEGSAARGYLLHLPLDGDGRIDETARSAMPECAVVHRFWAGEPEVNGYVVRTPRGWAFSYRLGEDDDEALFRLDRHAFRPGEYISLAHGEEDALPFRVVALQPLAPPAASSLAPADA